jgi:hypothetical protein
MLQSVLRLVVNVLDWTFLIVMQGRASGAFRVDVGCGTGRLTRHLRHEDIAGYLDVDIIPEIMQEAIDSVDRDARFSFAVDEHCRIPRQKRIMRRRRNGDHVVRTSAKICARLITIES